MTWGRCLLCAAVLGFAACGGGKRPIVEDLARHTDLAIFQLASLTGTRDGDRLHTQVLITDSSSMLTLELHFAVGVPTTLQSGVWRWGRNNRVETGSVTARSVTFLGGQDGPPSLGGTFDLLAPGSAPRYRVTLPVTPLRRGP